MADVSGSSVPFDSTPWVLGAGALIFGGLVVTAAVLGGPPRGRGRLDAVQAKYDHVEARLALDEVDAAYRRLGAAEKTLAPLSEAFLAIVPTGGRLPGSTSRQTKENCYAELDRQLPPLRAAQARVREAERAVAEASARLRDLNAVNRLLPRAPATTEVGRRAEALMDDLDAIVGAGRLNATKYVHPSYTDQSARAMRLRSAMEIAEEARGYADQEGAFPREIAEAEAAERHVAELLAEGGGLNALRVTYLEKSGQPGKPVMFADADRVKAEAYARTLKKGKVEEVAADVAPARVEVGPLATAQLQREAAAAYYPTRAERAGYAPPRGAYVGSAERERERINEAERAAELRFEHVTQGRLYGGDVNDLLDEAAEMTRRGR